MDIIDLSPWFNKKSKGGAINPDSAIIDQLRTALCNSGFLFLTGHGIPQSIIDGAFSSARAFFNRPLDEKKRMSSTFFRASRGYSALGSENFATLVGEVRPNDLVEKYRFGPCPVCPSEPLPKTTDEASSAVTGTSPTARPVHHVSLHENPYFHSKAARTHYAPNIYPPFQFDAGRLEAAVRSLYCAMEQLALILVEIFEKVLQMPPRFLARWFCNHRHTSILTLNSYPPLSDAILQRAHRQGQFRVAAHTDVSLFTLLLMDKPCLQGGGLQIQCARTGRWQPVGQGGASIVMNVGDLLADWSAGVLISTMHRVSLPPPLAKCSEKSDEHASNPHDASNAAASTGAAAVASKPQNSKPSAPSDERLSIAFFAAPAYNARIQPFKGVNMSINTMTSPPPTRDPAIAEEGWSSYDQWRKQRVKTAMKKLKWSRRHVHSTKT